jgi:diguanylate cyclase (GGDEF)-like protein
VSIGIASFPEDARNPETLLAKADEALYRSKHEGRNRISD